jgi:NTP pyrophosphatase (non-canonical NTP hydrolase)
MKKSKNLDLKKFRELSVKRAKEGFKTYDNVSILFFTTALAGELGEPCNLIKKIERAKAGGLDAGTNHKVKDISKELLAEEFGGIFIYLDLLASLIGVDLEEAIIKTFNDKSEENNLPFVYGQEETIDTVKPSYCKNAAQCETGRGCTFDFHCMD